jgi:DNA polymerase-3 subunit delta
LADTCLLKDLKKTQKILNEMILSNEDNIKLLKTFLLKLKKLKVISKKFNEVKNLENAISSIKPPIFWKEKDMVIRQFKKLSLNDISLLIKEINNLEYKIKKNSNISDLLLQDYIFKAAS